MLALSSKNYKIKAFRPDIGRWIITDLRSSHDNTEIMTRECKFIDLDAHVVWHLKSNGDRTRVEQVTDGKVNLYSLFTAQTKA